MGQDSMEGKVPTTLSNFLQETEVNHDFILKPNSLSLYLKNTKFEVV